MPCTLIGCSINAIDENNTQLAEHVYEVMSLWIPIFITALAISSFAAFVTALRLYRRNKCMTNSAAQFVIFGIFVSDFLWTGLRLCYYISFLTRLTPSYTSLILHHLNVEKASLYRNREYELEARVLDQIVNRALPQMPQYFPLFAYFSSIVYLVSLLFVLASTYELRRLVQFSKDRGLVYERWIVRRYALTILFFLTSIIGAGALIFMTGPGEHHRVNSPGVLTLFENISELVLVFLTLGPFLYMRYFSSHLDLSHARSSPLYLRLKRLMLSFAILSIPRCCLNILIYCFKQAQMPLWAIGLTTLMCYCIGLGNALVMGLNQSCCLRLCHPCLSQDRVHRWTIHKYVRQLSSRRHQAARATLVHFSNSVADLEAILPPLVSGLVVFVNTDIVGSTALWQNFPQAMKDAQASHDAVLRRAAVHYRGYEITTVGDAFQLAFRSVDDAIHWCVDVQKKFRSKDVSWPVSLPQGLHVRMGIHVADEEPLIRQVHPVTGRSVYSGPSEALAQEISDCGAGSEIIISDQVRVAALESKSILTCAIPEDRDMEDPDPARISAVDKRQRQPFTIESWRMVHSEVLDEIIPLFRIQYASPREDSHVER